MLHHPVSEASAFEVDMSMSVLEFHPMMIHRLTKRDIIKGNDIRHGFWYVLFTQYYVVIQCTSYHIKRINLIKTHAFV
jgi:hypothetical protein